MKRLASGFALIPILIHSKFISILFCVATKPLDAGQPKLQTSTFLTRINPTQLHCATKFRRKNHRTKIRFATALECEGSSEGYTSHSLLYLAYRKAVSVLTSTFPDLF